MFFSVVASTELALRRATCLDVAPCLDDQAFTFRCISRKLSYASHTYVYIYEEHVITYVYIYVASTLYPLIASILYPLIIRKFIFFIILREENTFLLFFDDPKMIKNDFKWTLKQI